MTQTNETHKGSKTRLNGAMNQLISQSRIDDAASIYAKIDTNSTNQRNRYIGFKSGVQFTLNEIQHLMVEFVIYCDDNYEEGRTNFQQLLEEFINDKNTKK